MFSVLGEDDEYLMIKDKHGDIKKTFNTLLNEYTELMVNEDM